MTPEEYEAIYGNVRDEANGYYLSANNIISRGLVGQIGVASSLSGQKLWDSYGLDPNGYTGATSAVKKGYEMSAADIQAKALDDAITKSQYDYSYMLNKKMYDETESYQAQVAQMREAGLNPALMYGDSVSTTNGADSASASGSSGTAGTGAVMASNAKAQIFMQALSQAMSIPASIQSMIAGGEQINQQRLTNEGIAYDNELKKNTLQANIDKTIAESRTACANAFVAENSKDAQVEVFKNEAVQSYIDIKSKELGVEKQSLENEFQEYQNKMAKIDADSREQLVQMQMQLEALRIMQTSEEIELTKKGQQKIDAEINQIKANIVETGKRCQLLQGEIDNQGREQFLAYMDGAGKFIDALTNNTSQSFGMGLVSGSDAKEIWQNGVSSVFAAIKSQYGDSGYYVSADTDVPYQLVTPYAGDITARGAVSSNNGNKNSRKSYGRNYREMSESD